MANLVAAAGLADRFQEATCVVIEPVIGIFTGGHSSANILQSSILGSDATCLVNAKYITVIELKA